MSQSWKTDHVFITDHRAIVSNVFFWFKLSKIADLSFSSLSDLLSVLHILIAPRIPQGHTRTGAREVAGGWPVEAFTFVVGGSPL